MQGAERNLSAEVPDNDFDKYRNAIRDNWNRQLSKIKVESSNNDDKVNFYTALYHSMIAPTIYSDVDGAYYGPDKQIHQTNVCEILRRPLSYPSFQPSWQCNNRHMRIPVF